MNELLARVFPHKTVAVIGLAKNTGKTMTVNYLVAQAFQEGLRLGLTSTGRDGETVDVLTALPKPAISLPQGTVLATARGSLGRGDARLEILETTGISNPLGEIVLARVREAGTVELSGPERTQDLRIIIQSLGALADLVIVDGALDRIAASAPAVTGVAILATGAVVAPDLEGIVRKTVHTAKVLMTPAVTNLLPAARNLLEAGKSGVQNPQGEVQSLPLVTVVDAPPELLDYLGVQSTLLLGGALTNELAEQLANVVGRCDCLEVIVLDGTRIFVGARQWQRLLRSGVKVSVMEPIHLAAITVNPVNSQGRRISSEKLVAALQELLPEQLVLDPLAEGGRQNEVYR